MRKEYYYRLSGDGKEVFYVKSKGKIDLGFYISLSKGDFQREEGRGELTLTEITKKEFEKVSEQIINYGSWHK